MAFPILDMLEVSSSCSKFLRVELQWRGSFQLLREVNIFFVRVNIMWIHSHSPSIRLVRCLRLSLLETGLPLFSTALGKLPTNE